MKHACTLIAVAACLASSVHAKKNDWSKPCLNGVCFYDHRSDPHGPNAKSSGYIKVWGKPTVIADITPAAGWLIMDCHPDKMQQDIRIVCKSNNADKAGCSHLFRDVPPEGKLVRLTEECGKMPFARIARSWVPENQNLTSKASGKVNHQGGKPQVHALSIDTNFAAANTSAAGPVNIQVVGANFPGADGKATKKGATRRNILDDTFNAIKGLDTVNEDVKKTFSPVNIQQKFPLFSTSLSCPASGGRPAFSIGASADLDYKAHAQVGIEVTATGTIIPPKLDKFGLISTIDADLSGDLNLKAQASGSIDTGVKTLFQTGIPGLDFPGVLTVGPTFKLNTNAKASLDVDIDMTVNLAYTIKNAQLFFPPASSQQKSGAKAAPANSKLNLSLNPNGKANGRIEAHVTPIVEFGLNALGNLASATINLDVDTSATMDLNGNANAQVAVPVGKAVGVKAKVNGCVDLKGAVNIDAGASASFFDLFNPSTKVHLFGKTFDLFKKCAGAGTKRAVPRGMIYKQLERKEMVQSREEVVTISGRALSCPALPPVLASLFNNQLIKGSAPA